MCLIVLIFNNFDIILLNLWIIILTGSCVKYFDEMVQVSCIVDESHRMVVHGYTDVSWIPHNVNDLQIRVELHMNLNK